MKLVPSLVLFCTAASCLAQANDLPPLSSIFDGKPDWKSEAVAVKLNQRISTATKESDTLTAQLLLAGHFLALETPQSRQVAQDLVKEIRRHNLLKWQDAMARLFLMSSYAPVNEDARRFEVAQAALREVKFNEFEQDADFRWLLSTFNNSVSDLEDTFHSAIVRTYLRNGSIAEAERAMTDVRNPMLRKGLLQNIELSKFPNPDDKTLERIAKIGSDDSYSSQGSSGPSPEGPAMANAATAPVAQPNVTAEKIVRKPESMQSEASHEAMATAKPWTWAVGVMGLALLALTILWIKRR